MNAYRPSSSSNYWLVAVKFILLLLGLYLSALILGRIFTWLFFVLFAVIKAVAFVVMAFLVLHFFLKILFKFDLYRFVVGSRFHRW
ncbi:hypothetical protein [Paradesulfitobacterium ferrireducens]|uniref:hypothetical protein n=1 Tax=Paradesulfitobacterium ferrireducens TaxID=2816476 RepID=UPI001A8CB795|nr:hypothetical protein [Paradesulfitobacterium ferrireducens]